MGEELLELPQGTLDLLILKALALAPLHGWAVSERFQQFLDDTWRKLTRVVGQVLDIS